MPRILKRLPEIVCVGLYGALFWFLWPAWVDVPTYDQWDFIAALGLPPERLASWLIARHNEHRIFLIRLITLVSYKVNGWDLQQLRAFYFLLYGALFVLLFWARGRVFGSALSSAGLALFCLFPLSPFLGPVLVYIHHSLDLIAPFLVILLWVRPAVGWGRLLAGGALLWVSVFSFSSGIPFAVSTCFFAILTLQRFGDPAGRRGRQAALLALTAGIVAAWTSGFAWLAHHPGPLAPAQTFFWQYLASQFSQGFGYRGGSWWIDAAAAVAVVLPVAILVGRTLRGGGRPEVMPLLALVTGILLVAVQITVARGDLHGHPLQIMRYARFWVMLVPLCALCWAEVLRDRLEMRRVVLTALWAFCFVGYLGRWTVQPIRAEEQRLKRGLACVEEHLLSGGPSLCPDLLGQPLEKRLAAAARLNVSFYRKIAERGRAMGRPIRSAPDGGGPAGNSGSASGAGR